MDPAYSLAGDINLRQTIFPGENVEEVVGFACAVCCTEIVHAAVLFCAHMFCVSCANDDRIKKCPDCQRPKRVRCMGNLGGLRLVRKSEQRRLERLVANSEAPQPTTVDLDEDEDLEVRNQDAIDDSIYQMGYDPAEYRRAVAEGLEPGEHDLPLGNYIHKVTYENSNISLCEKNRKATFVRCQQRVKCSSLFRPILPTLSCWSQASVVSKM